MPIDLDRYYTPERVALNALERADLPRAPKVCVDSTCGTGRLLDAANAVFGPVDCVGIDRDEHAISELRLKRPHWSLAIGDLLESKKNIISLSEANSADLLVLNPPFSLGRKKSIDITYLQKNMKGSVAMAHLLKSIELFKPSLGALIVVPESLLYSDTDAQARKALEEHYSLKKIGDLGNYTFQGARVHACVAQISPSISIATQNRPVQTLKAINTIITRGALPVYLKKDSPLGVPFVHSTDIRKILESGGARNLTKTSNIAKGRLEGWVILLPRVGMPDKRIVKAIELDCVVQLSDCVIALQFPSRSIAQEAERRIHSSWEDLCEIYKGTGARYTTISRLSDWLLAKSIIASN